MYDTGTVNPSTISPSPHSRLKGMDVARGVALLGIFFVNAKLFGQPFGEFMKTGFPMHEGWLSQVLYLFTEVFCTGKFYPLFSLLFGAGLAIMYQSAATKGSALVGSMFGDSCFWPFSESFTFCFFGRVTFCSSTPRSVSG